MPENVDSLVISAINSLIFPRLSHINLLLSTLSLGALFLFLVQPPHWVKLCRGITKMYSHRGCAPRSFLWTRFIIFTYLNCVNKWPTQYAMLRQLSLTKKKRQPSARVMIVYSVDFLYSCLLVCSMKIQWMSEGNLVSIKEPASMVKSSDQQLLPYQYGGVECSAAFISRNFVLAISSENEQIQNEGVHCIVVHCIGRGQTTRILLPAAITWTRC